MADIDRALMVRVEAGLRQFERAMARVPAVAGAAAAGAEDRMAEMNRRIAASAEQGAGAIGRSMRRSGVDTSNLVAQFQDIGVMLASGQSPLMLAVQQGSQISQVLGPLGARGAATALGGALKGLLNPMTFLTIGTIALGAAAVQWLAGINKDAPTAKDALDAMKNSVDAYRSALEAANAPMSELRAKYGEWAEEARADLAALAEARGRQVALASAALAQTATGGVTTTDGGMELHQAQSLAEQFGLSYTGMAGERRRQARALVDEVARAGEQVLETTSGTIEEQIVAARRLADAYAAAAGAVGGINTAEAEHLALLREQVLKLQENAALKAAAANPTRDPSAGPLLEGGLARDLLANERRLQLLDEIAAAEREGATATSETASTRERDAATADAMLASLRDQVALSNTIAREGEGSLEVAQERLRQEQDARRAAVERLDLTADQRAALESVLGLVEEIEAVDLAAPFREAADEAERMQRAAAMAAGADTLGRGRNRRRIAEMSGGGSVYSQSIEEAAGQGIHALIRRVEGTSGPNGYNTSLGNGIFTGGEQNLVNMSLREILALQRQMLAHPDNTYNSSALGAYQIVGTTLGGEGLTGQGGLIRQLGLDLDEKFSPELQDRLADELIRQRLPQGLTGFQQEWQGIEHQGVSEATLQRALGQQTIPAMDPELQSEADTATAEAAREAEAAAKRHLDVRVDLSEAARQQVADLAFENTLIGESAAEQARLRAEYLLLNQARRDGIDLNERIAGSELTYGEMIGQTATAIGAAVAEEERLNAEREVSAERTEFMAEMQQTLKNGLLDAIVAGDGFVDTLANLAKMLARASFEAALFGSGPLAGQTGGAGGGQGPLGGFLAGLFPGAAAGGTAADGAPLSAIPSLGSYEGGGYTGDGARTGGLDGRGGFPAILHPRETVIDHTRGQGSGGGAVDVRVYVDRDGNWQAAVERISAGVAGRNLAAYDQALPGKIRATRRDPRAGRAWS